MAQLREDDTADVVDNVVAKKEKKSKDKKKKKEKKDKERKRKAEAAEVEENGEVSPKKAKTEINGKQSSKKAKTTEEEETPPSIDLPELTQEQQDGAFSKFRISNPMVEKLQGRSVTYLFPIQAQTFDHVYDGFDVIAQARTGTGKTLSFALPLVEKLQLEGTKGKHGRPPKVLVMAPTRELAKQVSEDFESITETLKVFCIYGGTAFAPQEQAIRKGLDILVGTPGRILDYVRKGTLDLAHLRHVVLDEVDRMLDMGFTESVEEILQAAYKTGGVADALAGSPDTPQTLLFSATLPPWVHKTAQKYMKGDVKHVDLIGNQDIRTATTVQHMAIKCGYQDRAATIGAVIQVYSGNHGRAMVFCQTKRDADELAVSSDIKVEAHVLHGDVPQEKREMVLKKFREGKYRCLVTTDVAARGLDIPEVDLVIQCSPPKDVESYIHRSGRTGRAGREGVCICFYKFQEERDLQWVEHKAGIKFKRIGGPTPNDIIKAAAKDAA
ncbi:nucleolar RNA helicase 2-like, partial [Lingula anatina]|uniref:RNA helicase n=1 Tax=Lingula anatina TaxID=7574 RepID=A0A1S3HM17_LINAN